LVLSLYPAHFFYTFLYYTDVGSLFWVLLTHHLATPTAGKQLPSPLRLAAAAASGSISILFRQTNAVWLMFSFGTAVLSYLESSKKWGSELRADGGALTFSRLITFVKALVLELPSILSRFGLMLVPAVAFVFFVIWNGSIVVGHKEHHKAVFHWAQLAYLSAVTASLWGIVGGDAAVSLGSVRRFGAQCFSSITSFGLFIAALAFCTYALRYYSLAHSFLVADNRHYTFYIWNRFLGRIPGLKECLAPAYVYCAWVVCSRISRAQSPLWILIWWVAVTLTIVPAHLLEPRYLTTAVMLAHASSPERSWPSLIAGGVACLLVNVATLGIFVFKPFVWNDGSIARFMW